MDSIHRAAQAVTAAERVLITAGAGMGVDSGLPDFRSPEGFWRAYPKLKTHRLAFQEIANPRAFRNNAELAWAFYGHRYDLYKSTRPHAGFYRLLSWAKALPGQYFVFTSNVDGHFETAGFDAGRINECHGSIHHLQCTTPCSTRIWSEDLDDFSIDPETLDLVGHLPVCPECGAIARPNILMFGDFNWISDRTDSQHERYGEWLESTSGSRLVIIECGAGSAVPTVRYESERLARASGATLIRINPREAEGPPGTISIALPASEALERIATELPERFHEHFEIPEEPEPPAEVEPPVIEIIEGPGKLVRIIAREKPNTTEADEDVKRGGR